MFALLLRLYSMSILSMETEHRNNVGVCLKGRREHQQQLIPRLPRISCVLGGHLKTGHCVKSEVDVDAGQKTPGVVTTLTPDVSWHRASPKVIGHTHEIVREQVMSLETTEAGTFLSL